MCPAVRGCPRSHGWARVGCECHVVCRMFSGTVCPWNHTEQLRLVCFASRNIGLPVSSWAMLHFWSLELGQAENIGATHVVLLYCMVITINKPSNVTCRLWVHVGYPPPSHFAPRWEPRTARSQYRLQPPPLPGIFGPLVHTDHPWDAASILLTW